MLAMAPETNIGSSTPIDGERPEHRLRPAAQGDQRRGGLADARSRRATTATRSGPTLAVRKASNLTAQRGAEDARDRPRVAEPPRAAAASSTATGRRTRSARSRSTSPARRSTTSTPGFLTQLLNTLIDPNIISLLFLAGIAGIGFEIFHPGVVLPGALGGDRAADGAVRASRCCRSRGPGSRSSCSASRCWSPTCTSPSHGALTLTGLVALAVGLADAVPQRAGAVPRLGAVRVRADGGDRRHLGVRDRARRSGAPPRRRSSGPSEIVGEHGVVRGDGQVFVHGELWRARTPGRRALRPGDEVEVPPWTIDGLVLTVRPLVTAEPRTRITARCERIDMAAGLIGSRRRLAPDPAPVLGAEGGARVRARRRLPARPPARRAEGAGPVLPDPGGRPDGEGRPADDHAQHPAAGGDHEGQRARARERGRVLPDRRAEGRDRPGRELHGRDLADRADDAAVGARPAHARRAALGARQDQRDPPDDHRRGDARRGASRSRSSRSRTSRSRAACSARWRARPRPSASGARR